MDHLHLQPTENDSPPAQLQVPPSGRPNYTQSYRQLIDVVQELSVTRSLQGVMDIVRHAARRLTGADGATFVLRDGDKCYYAEEDAISPLWKGQRFPLEACISGWAMLNKRSAVIEDIYADPRIPADAYRPTFVKSLVMVPIRTLEPIGAIGNYWAQRREPTRQEVEILQALANATSLAMENVEVYNELEQRVQERTAQLVLANRELEAFSYSVSHDLRSPLQLIRGYADILHSKLAAADDTEAVELLQEITGGAVRMNELIEDLLRLGRIARSQLEQKSVDLSAMAQEIAKRLSGGAGPRAGEFVIEPGIMAWADEGLIRVVLENLLNNAWKYSSRQAASRVAFGQEELDGELVYFVADNGAGFDMANAERLFMPFQRLHDASEFAGTGVGLATVQRIITRHNGRIWAESSPGQGATLRFTLGLPTLPAQGVA